MAFLKAQERALAEAISRLAYCNPFLPERMQCEQDVLGRAFVERSPVWSLSEEPDLDHPNIGGIVQRAEELVAGLRAKLERGVRAADAELVIYEDVVLYVLFSRIEKDLLAALADEAGGGAQVITFYDTFARDAEHLLAIPGVTLPSAYDAAHLFASFFQVRRAFHYIYRYLIGGSLAAARLRATVWESIFTHDIRRYRRVLYDRMSDITTLVTGPSGTGKELVARAIALSQYIPFDEAAGRFSEDFENAFLVLNLSALSPTLIESELFGHRRGAFTGALEDRVGWLEVCSPRGAIFLDEIGDIDISIQVKLLRVIQTRTFQRIGETEDRRFEGKLIAATNRDLAAGMREGRFRDDLYYRLCSDIITTPSLHEQLRESPDELRNLTAFIARRIVDDEAEELAVEVVQWIQNNLGPGYEWPGNFRELEQCVRNILIRKGYTPQAAPPKDPCSRLADEFCEGVLTADELLSRYCTVVYAETGNYAETARRLGLDRRTVKTRIDEALLGELQNQR